jgi:SP family facilitated glucose transporter-like MFS transporter 1
MGVFLLGPVAMKYMPCVTVYSSFQLIQEWINYTDYVRSNYTVVPTEATITWIWSVAVSVYCIGGMIGGSLTGFFAEKFGR